MQDLPSKDDMSKSGQINREEDNVFSLELEGESRDSALRRMKTAETISMSPELFERLYLTPQTAAKGDLRLTWGNPSPL
jgi:uncharacterized protein